MFAIRLYSDLATPALLAWLRPHIEYDAGGRCSKVLKSETTPLPPELAAVAQAVSGHTHFREVVLQCYQHGRAGTPCHSDVGITGDSFILSLGAPRTFRIHAVGSPCDGPDKIDVQCVSGLVVFMEERFHQSWHHQLALDEGVTEERLGLVFRMAPGGKAHGR